MFGKSTQRRRVIVIGGLLVLAGCSSSGSGKLGKSGTVFVTDHGQGAGAAYRLDANGPTKLADVKALGDPGGVAVTRDESMLLVSSKNAAKGTGQVLLIDLKTLKTGVVDKVIGENKDAGGLHQASNANVFAWADVSRSGRIYRVDP